MSGDQDSSTPNTVSQAVSPSASASGTGYRAAGGTTTMAAVALVAAITSAFWAPPLFKFMHLRTPAATAQARQDVEIGRLNQSVADLERKLADTSATLARAQQDAAAAKAAQSAAETRVGLVALVQLQSALRRPGPFDVELALARASNPDLGALEPALAAVEKYAATGILVGSQLRQEFRDLADELGRRDFKVIPVAWINSLLGRPAPGEEPQSVVPPIERASVVADRVKERLAGGDLDAAVHELSPLSGEAAALVESWVQEARARIAADAAIAKLADRIGGKLARP
ncbi:hypothetical protein J2847_005360 [Azospirillum agricola]|uniref:hypothetical protein n=1 Tax=Azospirillum agricola TaxID=1720247 RepID=UPI001AEB2D5C|nr:hypothetical protein [Azospirillum agricola]MBP2232035.1 hypothetical protein [Azospirillum agricola]